MQPERLRTRVNAYEDGDWFRDALVAHADKASEARRKASTKARLNQSMPIDRRHTMSKEWPLWEVFIRSQHGLAHKHVGSLHAPDAEMAINNARDVYTRRNEGVASGSCAPPTSSLSSPADKDALFEPSNSKVYRHPTFFPMPEEVKHL